MPDETTETTDNPSFTCERCGFVYKKQKDYAPFLCHRCTRYISKKVYSIMQQVVPPVSRADRVEE